MYKQTQKACNGQCFRVHLIMHQDHLKHVVLRQDHETQILTTLHLTMYKGPHEQNRNEVAFGWELDCDNFML